MEVLVDLAEGGGEARLLQDAFVSIRVGKERRQGRFDGARKVSFSAAAGKERSCRVEVFRHLGSGYVKLRGGDSEVVDVEVPIGEPGLPKVTWKLSVRRSVQAMATSEREKRAQQKCDAAHEYWKKHSLDVELVDIIRQLLRDKPENPRVVLSSSIKKVMDPRGDFGDDDPTSGPEEEVPQPQPAAAEHHPSMPSRPRSVEPTPRSVGMSPRSVEMSPMSPYSGAAAVVGETEERQPAEAKELARPHHRPRPSPVEQVVEEVLHAQFRPRSRSTVVEGGLREDEEVECVGPNEAASTATAECSAPAEEPGSARPGEPAPAAAAAQRSAAVDAAEEPEKIVRPDEAAAAAAAKRSAAVKAADEPEKIVRPDEATTGAQPRLLLPPEEEPFVEAAAVAGSQPIVAQPRRNKLSRPGVLWVREELTRCRPGSPWTVENSSQPSHRSRNLGSDDCAAADPAIDGSCHKSAAGSPTVGHVVAEQPSMEAFFLTELEPSEPSARAAGNATTEAPASVAEGRRAPSSEARRQSAPLPPRAVEMVRKASKGARAYSYNASPEPSEVAARPPLPPPAVEMAKKATKGARALSSDASPKTSEATAERQEDQLLPPRTIEMVRKASKASRAFSSPQAHSLPDPGGDITRLVALYDFDPAIVVWPYEQSQPLAVVAGQHLQVLKDEVGEWVFGHVVGSPEVTGCFPRGVTITLAEYRQITAKHEVSPQDGAASLPPHELEMVRSASQDLRARPTMPEASSALPQGGDNSLLVALYAFDPTTIVWPFEQAPPLAVEEGYQLQVLSDNLGEWVFGHVVGIPEVAGYFPRCITVTAAEYRRILLSHEDSHPPSFVAQAEDGGSEVPPAMIDVEEGSRLVALYDFDPASIDWPYEQVLPLAVETGHQLQVLSDDSGEWVFGHVVGTPDAVGYFPRCITVTMAEYRRIMRSYEESSPPSSLREAAREAEERSMSHIGSVTSHWSASRSSLDGRDTVRLRVTIERAMNLRNADWLDLSDPYVIMEIRGAEPQRFRTKVILDNLHPVWEETYEFDYKLPKPIHFSVWDKDFGKRDDFLGKATLTPDMFWNDGFEGYVVLQHAGKKDGKDALLFLQVERAPCPT